MPEKVTKWFGWRWVFVAVAALYLVNITALISAVIPFGMFEFVNLMIYALVVQGVYGYAYNRHFYSREFWLLFFPVAVMWDAFDISRQLHRVQQAINFLILFGPLLVLQYYALYRYPRE